MVISLAVLSLGQWSRLKLLRSKETTQRQCLKNKVRGVNRRTSAHLRILGAMVIL